MRRLVSALILMLALAASGAARAQMHIHVVPRTDAGALVREIRPLLPEGGYVNAYQGQLIIRTTDANFQQIQSLLGRISDHPRTVTVYLKREGTGDSGGAGLRLDRHGATVIGGGQHSQSHHVYSVSTLSGHPAAIDQGNLMALTGGEYPVLVSLQQGISVTPTVTADGQVQLRIAQRFDRPDGNGANTQSTASTLRLTPGQWQPLGSIDVSERRAGAGLGGGGSTHHSMHLPLDVKVELQGPG